MLKEILGPSPLIYGMKKVHNSFCYRNAGPLATLVGDETPIKIITDEEILTSKKIPRMTNAEVRNLLSNTAKLTKEQRLLKSVLEEAALTRTLTDKNFKNLEEMYEFRRKYKRYLRIKRFIPLCTIAPFTTNELSKMAYAAAIGSKSVSLTMPGLIGYSLPAFFFFHMSSFYAPDKLKPICEIGKYTLGAPFWLVGTLTDEFMSSSEEALFGEEVPLDVTNTGGTIPGDLGSLEQLRQIIKDLPEFTKKSY